MAICRHAAIDPTGAELVKYTMNAVYRLDRAGLVVRIATGAGGPVRADRVARVADLLGQLDVPVARLAPGFEQAIHANGWSATVWTLLPQEEDAEFVPADLAGPLAAIHAVSVVPDWLPRWDPITKSRQRLAQLDALDQPNHDFMNRWALDLGQTLDQIVERLNRWCDQLDVALDEVEWHLPPGVIHGDAHTGNLLTTREPQTVLCDLDSAAIGPREWDLTPAAHGVARFGRDPAQYQDLVSAYGWDVTTWPGWPTLRQIRELQLVTSVIASLHGRPDVADELAQRLRTVLSDDQSAFWHRYR